MGMMEHIAFQSFWQRGKTFAHSKGTEIPSLPSMFTVDPYCPCSFDWCGLLKVHGRMRPSVTWCTKRGFCLPSSWSWAELQQPVASREEQSVVERWSYDEIPTFCNIPKASKALLKGWHLRQILELLQRLPSHNFAGGFDNCRVHLRRAGRWTVDTWHILTPISKLFKLHSVQTIACQAPTCGKKREKSDCYNSDVGKTWTCMMLDQIACGTPGPLLSAPKFGSLSVNKIENLIWTNKIEQYIYLHQMGST